MRNRIFIISLLCSVLLYMGCKSPEEKIEEIITQMKSKPVSIPFSEMSCWINDSVQAIRPWEEAKLKLVVFTDSSSCSECTLKRMYLWSDFVELEQKYNNQFYIMFIFQTKKGTNVPEMATSFHLTELNHPIYVDSKDVFRKLNPHLPEGEMYSIYLLDENNNIQLVGSPLFNTGIEDELHNILEEKLGKKEENLRHEI